MARRNLGASFSHCLRVRCFFQQQVTEPLFEAVEDVQDGMSGQISGEFLQLSRSEVVAMTAEQRDQAAISGAGGIELPPAGEEVMINQTDDVETIGDDAGVR